jgi:hypothetical protein
LANGSAASEAGHAAGGAIAFAVLTNRPMLTASDFLVI